MLVSDFEIYRQHFLDGAVQIATESKRLWATCHQQPHSQALYSILDVSELEISKFCELIFSRIKSCVRLSIVSEISKILRHRFQHRFLGHGWLVREWR